MIFSISTLCVSSASSSYIKDRALASSVGVKLIRYWNFNTGGTLIKTDESLIFCNTSSISMWVKWPEGMFGGWAAHVGYHRDYKVEQDRSDPNSSMYYHQFQIDNQHVT